MARLITFIFCGLAFCALVPAAVPAAVQSTSCMETWLIDSVGIPTATARTYVTGLAQFRLTITILGVASPALLQATGITSKSHQNAIISCASSPSTCSKPCQNGGECILSQSAYICECLEGFSGDRCQTSQCDSSQDPCFNALKTDLTARINQCKSVNDAQQSTIDRLEILLNRLNASTSCLIKEKSRRRQLLTESWVAYDDNGCFYKMSPGSQLFRQASVARGWCQSQSVTGADLVTVDSDAEFAFLQHTFPKDYWVGVTDEGHEGTWTRMNDGRPARVFWAPGEPNNAHQVEHCAYSSTSHAGGKWYDGQCETWAYFHSLCKVCFAECS